MNVSSSLNISHECLFVIESLTSPLSTSVSSFLLVLTCLYEGHFVCLNVPQYVSYRVSFEIHDCPFHRVCSLHLTSPFYLNDCLFVLIVPQRFSTLYLRVSPTMSRVYFSHRVFQHLTSQCYYSSFSCLYNHKCLPRYNLHWYNRLFLRRPHVSNWSLKCLTTTWYFLLKSTTSCVQLVQPQVFNSVQPSLVQPSTSSTTSCVLTRYNLHGTSVYVFYDLLCLTGPTSSV